MAAKYILCFAVLIAAIEALPRPAYIAVPREEYEALINGQHGTQSHGLAALPLLSRHKRSSTQFTPSEQYRPYKRQQYKPRRTYNFAPQYNPQQFEASVLNPEASVLNPVVVRPERPRHGGYKQQYRPKTQEYAPSQINEVRAEPEYRPVIRPFTGGNKPYELTQEYAPSQVNEIRAEPEYRPVIRPFTGGNKPSELTQGYAPSQVNEIRAEPEYRPAIRPFTGGYDGTPDLDQGASATHEKRDAGYGGGHAGGDDHVDYGAYTGSHGAFGWYSDHPVLVYRR